MGDLASIEAKLQRLQDLEDIKRLRHKYSYGANIVDGKSGDLKAFAALFADDADFDVGMGPAKGPAEIEAMMKELTTQWQCAMHYMLNQVIDLDGDKASGNTTGLFAFTTEDNPRPIWLSNIYTETFSRTADGWRFQTLSLETVFADPVFLEGYADELAS